MAASRRIQYDQYGGPERMELAEFTPAAPGKGEVLVRVRAAAANGLDWKIRNGDMKFMTGRNFPRGLGHDFAGVVDQVGEGVTRFRAGDEVLGTTSLKAAGAFAEMVLAKAGQVVKKPGGLSDLVGGPWRPLVPEAVSEGTSPVKERAPARDLNRAGSPSRDRIWAAPTAPTPGTEVMMPAGSSWCSRAAILVSRSRISADRASARRASAAMSSARSG